MKNHTHGEAITDCFDVVIALSKSLDRHRFFHIGSVLNKDFFVNRRCIDLISYNMFSQGLRSCPSVRRDF